MSNENQSGGGRGSAGKPTQNDRLAKLEELVPDLIARAESAEERAFKAEADAKLQREELEKFRTGKLSETEKRSKSDKIMKDSVFKPFVHPDGRKAKKFEPKSRFSIRLAFRDTEGYPDPDDPRKRLRVMFNEPFEWKSQLGPEATAEEVVYEHNLFTQNKLDPDQCYVEYIGPLEEQAVA